MTGLDPEASGSPGNIWLSTARGVDDPFPA